MTALCRMAHRVAAMGLAMAMLVSAHAQTATPTAQPPVTPPSSFPAAPTGPLTIDEAVAFALQHSPAITFSAQNVQIAQDQVSVARASGRPTVGVTATSGTPADTFNLFTTAQASVTQPIWPSSRWQAPTAAARANVGVSEEDLLRTRQQVVFQTRQAFYQLLTAQELLEVANYAFTVAETQLRLANANFTAGTAPRLDVWQAEATLEDARVGVVRAQNTVDIARTTLVTQLGLPAGTPVAIVPTTGLPSAPAPIDPLIAQAYTTRPEMRQLEYRRRIIRANIETIRLQQRPQVDLQANYTAAISGESLMGPEGLQYGANVRFNLYNGGRTRAELAAARTQLEQVETNTTQLALVISQEVRQAWLNLQNALQQLSAAERQQRAAQEALRIAELRYREGEGIQLEVEQARLRSTQALTSLSQARFQAQVAAAQLDFAIGAPVQQTPPPAAPAPR